MEIVKWLILVLSIILIVCAIVLIIKEEPKEETFDDGCSEWEIKKLPSNIETGLISRKCKKGDTETFILPLLTSSNYIKAVIENPTCEKEGQTKYTICAKDKYFSFVIVDSKLEHEFGDTVYSWNQDNTNCIAKRTCKNEENYYEISEANIISEVTKVATCSQNGSVKYTAIFPHAWARTQVKTVDNIEIIEDKHDYNITYSWNEDKTVCIAKKVCKNNKDHVMEYRSTNVVSAISKVPTFTEGGSIRFYPVFMDESLKTSREINIPNLTSEEYILSDTLVEPKAYSMGSGNYNYTYNGIKYTFTSDIMIQNLQYYFNKHYYEALDRYLSYDGNDRTYIDNLIKDLKQKGLKVYNNKELKTLVEDYNKKNQKKLTFAVLNGNDKLTKTIYDTITKADYDVQVIAHIDEGCLKMFVHNNILMSDNLPKLKKELEIAYKNINYQEKIININDEALMIIDELKNNYVSFEMLESIEYKETEEVLSKDGRFLIDLKSYKSNYAVPSTVEYILSQSIENETNHVTIPSKVKYIGKFGTGYVDTVTIASNANLEYIGEAAFSEVNFINADFSKLNNLTYIGKKAFYDAKIDEVRLVGVIHIGDEAFASYNEDTTNINVYLPMTLQNMGENVFINRKNLVIHVNSEAPDIWGKNWNDISKDGLEKANVIVEVK